jgi:hypothetical protein
MAKISKYPHCSKSYGFGSMWYFPWNRKEFLTQPTDDSYGSIHENNTSVSMLTM